jgi:uncharacterized protein YbaR (Trm112 family)
MDKYLLKILVCPKSGGILEYDEKNNELVCKESNLAYPIVDDIPIMLVDKARKISKED